ncbi:protein DpdF [Caballeronia sp. Lep1P3]|uniref:protein DpdF n=1 Tax=Caballeronia sp. Lep1P3 TaxID=2878150 RepID=UPI001FD40695|nr:protein DpdF [Caballeronia sp. Lep1P3]
MSFIFADLQSLFNAWPATDVPIHDVGTPIFNRVCQILRDAQSSTANRQWHGDLMPLVRQCLLRESALQGYQFKLRVPANPSWPSAGAWANHGMHALAATDGKSYLLTAQSWSPDWFDSTDDGAFHGAFSDVLVRTPGLCPADPFIVDATGFSHYSSPGQREAVRASFIIPPGDTLFVNLPTGSGKSLVGQAGALVHKEAGHLTVFVVPTVALAIDQERAMLKYFRQTDPTHVAWPLSWHGDLSKEGRVEIRRRIRDGTQRILFTSPEALNTSLLSAVTDAAHAGMLRYLVVDEAHLVSQWGDEFRPTFQALAGLRNNLLSQAPYSFRTLLMSATFTEETVETLAHLFGPAERVQMVAAVNLRPEPQYWTYRAASPADKHARVLEALRHAPRPFILYVTKREDVRVWNSVLRSQGGLHRIACFDGTTLGQKRREIIDEWAADRLDGIIATSAFGVGIDKADVRTIIHAAIPETLDRFYQEVGRGGRDGRPSVSLVAWDDTDWEMPKRLSQPKLVTEEMGYSRWRAMYQSRKSTAEEGLYLVDIDAVRGGLPGSSEYNVNWNMRTLILMARAGMISLDLEPSDEVDLDRDDLSTSLLAIKAKIRVRILHDGHQLPEVWETRVVRTREKTIAAAQKNLGLMRRLLQGNEEVGDILSELYRIRSSQWPVSVTHVCGGCKQDRFISCAARDYRMPVPIPIARVCESDFTAWKQRFTWIDPAFVYIFYDANAPLLIQSIIMAVGWLVQECGVQEVAVDVPSSLCEERDWQLLYRRSPSGVVLHRGLDELDNEPYSPLARVTVLWDEVAPDVFERIQVLQRPHHLILLPRSYPDPDDPLRRLADMTSHAMNLQQLLETIRQ